MVTVYKFRKIIGKANFSEQLKKIVTRYKTICYNMDILRQNEYMVVNPVTIDNLTINDCVIGPSVNCLVHRGPVSGFLVLWFPIAIWQFAFCYASLSKGHLGEQVSVRVLTSYLACTLASTLNEVYKLLNSK